MPSEQNGAAPAQSSTNTETKTNGATTGTVTGATVTGATGIGQGTSTKSNSKSDTKSVKGVGNPSGTTGNQSGQNPSTSTSVNTSANTLLPPLSAGQSSSTTSSVAGGSTSSITGTAATAASATSTNLATKKDEMATAGELAGAVIASIVGAAIITFLVTWLFFRKRNKRNERVQRAPSHHSRDHRSPGRHGAPVAAAAGMIEKSSSSSDASGFSWQAYLPQSADDQTVSRDVKTLFDQIELHVDNYYTKASVRIDSNTSRALSQFGDDNLPESIDALLANPQTTLPTIKHCIAKTLLARMSPGHERTSLLPEYFSAEPTKLNSSMPPGEQTAAQQAYSQWRLLNAYLHPHPEQDRAYQQRRDSAAQDINGEISTAFAPWQGPKENVEGLKQHERSLVMRASDVATLIMSQPSTYEFRWNASSRSFVVLPGFVKTTDERGRPLEQPQNLVQPVLARG